MPLIGVDTGGTFTDFIVNKDDRLEVLKVLSTPANPAQAVIQGLGQLVPDREADVVHGSTVATNAILERKGVPTALVTNQGFTDIIQIGRQQRGDLYDLAYRRPPSLVPEGLRFGVPGRIGSDGQELEPFDETAARETARSVAASGAESVAVCLLFSFLDPAHELAMGSILAEEAPGLAISLSHRILAEFREFERTSTTAVNAYVAPKMDRYLAELEENVTGRLRIMQSNGGSISSATARREPVRTILSGPAGGVVGALAMGRAAGFDKLMTFDMGGTSTDVALMDGQLPLTTGTVISGSPVKTPMLDIHTVGAGGGSLAALDAGGSLTVGPQSAGADPGPLCYGRSALGADGITVTDANLFLGRLAADHFLGGKMRLDRQRLLAPMNQLAGLAGLTAEELAEGILHVADSNMERALRVISVERGFDPREFTLFSFGGAGGMHCASLVRALGMDRVLVPANPGTLSAMGMLLSDVIMDDSLTVMLDAAELTPGRLDELFAPLEERGLEDMRAEGDFAEVVLARSLDMRYQGQSFELMVGIGPDTDPADAFQDLHEHHYGHRNPDTPVECVNLRLRTVGVGEKPVLKARTGHTRTVPEAARLETRPAIFSGKTYGTALFERSRLLPGNRIPGPAIVVEYSSTIVIPPDAEAKVDSFGNLLVTMGD